MPNSFPGLALRIQQKLGFRSHQNLYWSCRSERNFGDWIGPWIFERLSRRNALFCMPSQLLRGHLTFTVGSILHWINAPNVVDVWGSGIIGSNVTFERPRKIYAVRGPRSRERVLKLGYECPKVYGDPALLMPLLFQVARDPVYDVGIVPHFVDGEIARNVLVRTGNYKFIDIRSPQETVIREILSCRYIASSSLHGIIIAHAYKIPAVQLKFSGKLAGDGIKFLDYIEAFGLGRPIPLLDLTGDSKRKDIVAFIRDSGWFPDVRDIQMNLLDSCPFISQRVHRQLTEQI